MKRNTEIKQLTEDQAWYIAQALTILEHIPSTEAQQAIGAILKATEDVEYANGFYLEKDYREFRINL